MQIIADSGATKVSWRVISDAGEVSQVETSGINAVFMEEDAIESILRDRVVPAAGRKVDEIFFYGAGLVGGETNSKLERCLSDVFPGAKVEAYSDILAAARALCGRKPGIACILGTGSNSCFYDGAVAESPVKAGGFILGDEASGAYFGKRLLSDFIKGLLPPALEKEFTRRFPDLDYPAIVQKVYREPLPNRFLASFSPFLREFRNHPHISAMLKSGFEEFLRRNVVHYDYKKYPVNFVGSVAYYHKDILEKTVAAAGMRLGKVLRDPIDGLMEYHKTSLNA